MGSNWARAASFALAAIAAAGGEAQAQTVDQWDRKSEPIEGRPDEYRTDTTETWIRLTPYVGGLFWDGGTRLTGGPQFGLALEFEPADILIASIDVGTNIPLPDMGAQRRFTENRDGTNGDRELYGHEVHPALYVGLKNPEIRAGILQPILGLGFGAFYFHQYDTEDNKVGKAELPVLGFVDPARVHFRVAWAWHVSAFLRFDFDVSEHVKFGINLKNHFLFLYRGGDDPQTGGSLLGNMLQDKIKFDNIHYVFEPAAYFSISF